ncbi:MAG TPA: gamma-glutamylcyclotransferase family protein [Gemmataceae bacterium]|nr:gamma-glutamylcyclotransferase family protein [Gemmataceae bacterium]
MCTLIFVYGTLKRGQRNNGFLAGQEFRSVAQTLPRYRLVDNGAHPCLVEDPGHGVAVQGELWCVDEETLARLDKFEEVPRLFDRRAIDLTGISTVVFAYFYQGDTAGMKNCGDCWPAPSQGAC